MSRTEVAFNFYARSTKPIKIGLSALVALSPHLDKCNLKPGSHENLQKSDPFLHPSKKKKQFSVFRF
jgi:hypothetical protein